MDLLVESLAASGEVGADASVFGEVPPDADRHGQASARQPVERRCLLGHEGSLSLREDHDARTEPQGRGRRSQKTEEGEHLVEGIFGNVGRAGEPADGSIESGRVSAQDVIERRQVGEAERLGRLAAYSLMKPGSLLYAMCSTRSGRTQDQPTWAFR